MKKGQSPERKLNTFLALLIVSLIGNACADFAIVWHAVAQLSTAGGSADSSRLLSSYYVGQSFGVILLAPLLSAFIDRHSQRYTSVGLDLAYALVLVALMGLNVLGHLGPETLFPFAIATAALGALHRNAIGLGALKALSQDMGVTQAVAKFSAASFFTNLVGSAVAGVAYKWIGLNGCLILAILTFVPMPFIYFQLFPRGQKKQETSVPQRHLWREFREGLSLILNDRLLLTNSLAIAIWNLSSNIFPGIVGIAFQKSMPGHTDYASFAVSGAILVGVLSFGPLEKVTKRLPVRRIMPLALAAPFVMMLVCAVFPGPLTFTLGFALHCCEAAMVNILSGSVRVSRVPTRYTARVNTAHSAIMSIGQVAGGLCLIPLLESSLSVGALVIALSFVCSGLLAYAWMPSKRLNEILEVQA